MDFRVMRSIAGDQEDEEALSCEVSDETLEAAATLWLPAADAADDGVWLLVPDGR